MRGLGGAAGRRPCQALCVIVAAAALASCGGGGTTPPREASAPTAGPPAAALPPAGAGPPAQPVRGAGAGDAAGQAPAPPPAAMATPAAAEPPASTSSTSTTSGGGPPLEECLSLNWACATTTTTTTTTATAIAAADAAAGKDTPARWWNSPASTTAASAAAAAATAWNYGFAELSMGWGYSCLLYQIGTLACWRMDSYRDYYEGAREDMEARPAGWSDDPADLKAPPGLFKAVSAGWGYACGIRLEGQLECWGQNPAAGIPPPPGAFKSLSVGVEHACALRTDGEAECWGEPQQHWRSAWDAPPGGFTDMATGKDFSCGLRPGGEAECWGGRFGGATQPPPGPYQSLEDAGHVCGIRPGGEAECWGSTEPAEYVEGEYPGGDSRAGRGNWRYRHPLTPDVPLLAISSHFGCGVGEDHQLVCWVNVVDEHEMLPAPAGEYTSVSNNSTLACAVRRADSTVRCWDRLSGEQRPAPEGEFQEIQVGGAACGIRPGGEVDCWWAREGSIPQLEGRFKSISGALSLTRICGIRLDDTLECWPDSGGPEWAPPPAGEFTKISVSHYHACALRPDGEIQCWGAQRRRSKTNPPEGEFTAINAGWGGYTYRIIHSSAYVDRNWGYSCGLRPNGAAECWGSNRDITEIPMSDLTKPYETGGKHVVGKGRHKVTDPPEGEFTYVGAGRSFACGLRPAGTVECWGYRHFKFETPKRRIPPKGPWSPKGAWSHPVHFQKPGDFVDPWAYFNMSYGLPRYQTGEWRPYHYTYGEELTKTEAAELGIRLTPENFPSLRPRCLNPSWCAITYKPYRARVDNNYHYPYTPGSAPVKEFTALSVGAYHACGLHPDGSVECWNADRKRSHTWRDAFKYTSISTSYHTNACAIKGPNAYGKCFGY